jgi:ferredoxin
VKNVGNFLIVIDKTVCRSFGACIELCPQYFHFSDIDGTSSIKGATAIREEKDIVSEQLEVDELGCIKDAAEACPFKAIHITDLKTGEKH